MDSGSHNSISPTEENYLKAIFKITAGAGLASTNAIAQEMETSPASVSDMIKRLSRKHLIDYEKWKGVSLTKEGRILAITLIRRHRLWEVFLVEKLHFAWDEVHEIAEQLEHIASEKLIERLDEFLGTPKFDPHGDPIPDAEGIFAKRKQVLLSELNALETGVIVGVHEHSTAFLQYLDRMDLVLGAVLKVQEIFEYDGSMRIELENKTSLVLSSKVSQHLFVQRQKP
ncbi:MAG: metal-dependent transcriptional regulator [Saprospiraceae bacterium]|nr:metal-dependent transcriptional regulator [Saprospiraceae bacterium]